MRTIAKAMTEEQILAAVDKNADNKTVLEATRTCVVHLCGCS